MNAHTHTRNARARARTQTKYVSNSDTRTYTKYTRIVCGVVALHGNIDFNKKLFLNSK